MCKINKKWGDTRIDPCMRNLIQIINVCTNYRTVACCCGHGKYNMSIVCKATKTGECFDMMSFTVIPRKKRFYKRDSKGYYYIPEVVNNGNR